MRLVALYKCISYAFAFVQVDATKLVHEFRAATLECNAGRCVVELLLTLYCFVASFSLFLGGSVVRGV